MEYKDNEPSIVNTHLQTTLTLLRQQQVEIYSNGISYLYLIRGSKREQTAKPT